MAYHECYKDEDTGQLAPYAWPGGYLIEWVTEAGDSLCAECATRLEVEESLDVAPFTHEAEAVGFECDECHEYKT